MPFGPSPFGHWPFGNGEETTPTPGSGSLSVRFQTEISNTVAYFASPTGKNIVNELDYIAQLLDLNRLPGEKNQSFKRRVLDVFVHRAGANYQGLINGILRELNLNRYEALTISLKESGGVPVTQSPRIVINSTEMILYSEWTSPESYTVEKTINLYDRSVTNNGYYLGDLVTQINTSLYYSAALVSGVSAYTRSNLLFRYDSLNIVNYETYSITRDFKLENEGILKNSLFFYDTTTFSSLKSSVASLAAVGDYYVDLDNGIVRSYSLPTEEGWCRYAWSDFPVTLEASPVFMFSLSNQDVVENMFDSLGDYYTLPNTEMTRLINSIFNEVSLYWGE